jgi:quinol-cytochrome oxidoreductase complex cytochrome b subunit
MAQFTQSIRKYTSQLRGLSRQDIREMVDTRVRIITAGLGLDELRALVRGEPPTEKPNPRYRVHVTSFIVHIRPKFYQRASTWFTHTFRLGYLTFFFFLVETITGLVLMVYYSPTPETAYQTILDIESRVPFGAWMRNMHRIGAEAMVAFVWLHLFRTYFTGSYKGKASFTWLTGVVLLILTVFLSFSGYLLPWDQLAYWAVTIGTSMADKTPIIGEQVNLILRGAPDIGAGGLLRFYLGHVILLPLIAILFISIHYYKVAREHSISLPAVVEEGDLPKEKVVQAKQRIDLIPDLLTNELFWACLGLIFLVVIPTFFYTAPLESHANPLKTPLDTKAPWYFWWLQGLLKLGDPTLMGVVIPTILVGGLFAVPYVDRNPKRMARFRPFAIAWGLIWIIILGVLSYMGTPEYGIETPSAARIMQDLAPEEGIGPLRAIPFEDLQTGIYIVNETDPETLPGELGEVFEYYTFRVNDAEEKDPDFNNPEAFMLVSDWAPDLKRVTMRILWEETNTDTNQVEDKSLEHLYYLHADRRRGE